MYAGLRAKGLCLLVLSLLANVLAWGCAEVFSEGRQGELSAEEALILWDAQHRTEHFIRQVNFRTDAKDFGFLVPTPTVPKLAEADAELFGVLGMLTWPRKDPRFWREAIEDSASDVAAAAPAVLPPVEVIEETRVAGLDAAVLRADNSAALGQWLARHGYQSTPALLAWIKPYVAQRWVITAFKVSPGAKGDAISGAAVRMSFATERPFFPYLEPKGNGRRNERQLHVYLLAESRYAGALGSQKTAWPASALWSDTIGADQLRELLKRARLPADTAPGAMRLTEFMDTSIERLPDGDLFFAPAQDQSVIWKYLPSRVASWVWGALVLGLLLVLVPGVQLYTLLRRRRVAVRTPV
ncbi:DUF2330 domain-containing protein [Chitinimonas naiadis]